jgi:hypothetical protein
MSVIQYTVTLRRQIRGSFQALGSEARKAWWLVLEAPGIEYLVGIEPSLQPGVCCPAGQG